MRGEEARTFCRIVGGYRMKLRKGEPFTSEEAEELVSLLDHLEGSVITAQEVGQPG
jgi:hypothetical protein